MKPLYLLVVLAFFSNVQTCFGDMIFTVTATDRVDTATQVTITYTVTGAADVGTQDFAAFSVRVAFPAANFPVNSLASTPLGATRAPDNTTFGQNAAGPITFVSVLPNPNAIRWQANELANISTATNQTVGTAGAVVGTYNLIWNRPTSGQYEAAMNVNNMLTGYKVAPFTSADAFIVAQNRIGVGVSTTISAVPEPSAMTLIGLVAMLGTGRRWLRRRR